MAVLISRKGGGSSGGGGGGAPTGAAGGSLGGTYPNPSIAAGAVDTAELANDAVDSTKIAANAVGSSELADDAVDTAAIQNNAVTAAKVAADVATQAELDAVDAAVVHNALFDANTVLAANADNTPAAVTMAASTILARLAAGNIKAASVAEIITLLQAYTVGGTDVAVADGGTGASTAAAALTNLGAAAAVAGGRAVYGGVTQFSIPGVFPTSGGGNHVTVGGRAQYFPFKVDTSIVIDQLIFELATGVVGSTSRAAIYNADTSWQPTTLVANCDTGAKNTAAGDQGVIATTITDATLTPGRYLFWLNVSTGNPQFRGPSGLVGALMGYPVALGNNMNFSQFYVAQTYGAPPATADAWTTVAVASGANSFVWPIYVRIKTP